MDGFAVITKEIQKNFEELVDGTEMTDYIPIICGYVGRGCLQLGKSEGCNRRICEGCALADFAEGIREYRKELERKCMDILMADMQHVGESEEILKQITEASDEDLINFLAEQED